MIRYPTNTEKLTAAVDAAAKGWLADAEARTAHFRKLKKYQEPPGKNGKPKPPGWGKIKNVFRDLQHMKCAYCERKLEGDPQGSVEWDVEHYRPKSSVKAWPTKKVTGRIGAVLNFPLGEASEKGYYLLPYSVWNYLAACKPCNTPRKSNFFPVAGARRLTSTRRETLRKEQPYLPHPLDNTDDDPEELITFQGFVPVPRDSKDNFKRRRALVTINFFELNVRTTLLEQRAMLIHLLWIALEGLRQATDAEDRKDYQQVIERAVSPKGPHTSCARAFVSSYQQDRKRPKNILMKQSNCSIRKSRNRRIFRRQHHDHTRTGNLVSHAACLHRFSCPAMDQILQRASGRA